MHHSDFVHLHLHTAYSLLDGAIRTDELLDRAVEFKMPAVAVTDHGNLFGALDFYKKALSKGVKPIIGCEAYVAPGSRHDRTPPRGGAGEAAFHIVLLVKNEKGYKNLCRLISAAYLEGFYYKPRIDKDLLREHNEGLIALSACLHGEVAHNLNAGRPDEAEKIAREYAGIFTDRRFYLEIQDNGLEEQRKVNRGLEEISEKTGIPLVATNDCHYLRKEDSKYHDILLCIQTGSLVNDENRMRFTTEEFYLKSPDEMRTAFADHPEAVKNTIEIAERCNYQFNLDEYHLPEFPVPDGETLEGIFEKKTREGLEKRLADLGEQGAADVDSVKWQYYERLEKEIKVIKGMGFPGYFLIVTDFIEYARSKDISVGPGRGSAAGSLVAYALGITNLDPIRYNLLFERFLNPDRVSLPDIDIDFCFERRDEVIRYVTEKYGAENVCQIITFGQMKARACIRDVGRVLDVPYGEVDKIAKLVPATLNITIEEALEQEPKLKDLADEDPRVGELIDAAIALEGLPRHASTHAAGVVISNKPLTEYLPLFKGTRDEAVTTQLSMKDVEDIGLVKFDFLGLKTLTVIDKAVKLVKSNRGVDLDMESIPLDDRPTYDLLASGATDGVFQLESSGMKELLRKLKAEEFEDLIAAVALYRPGPLQSGMVDDFIKRKHGRTKAVYETDALKPILETTCGVMVYQEQVMEIAKVLAGYTPGDADVLRKAMGKKIAEQMVQQRTKFLEGAKKNKVPQKKAEKIFDLMAKFAGYGFNKSHSAAYALIAYQTAFLKAHYPVEFIAALLSSDMDNTDQVVKYTNGCRESGIDVIPPEVNRSMREFTVDEGRIVYGLGAVKNVGTSAIEEILRVRGEDGPFESLLDFLVRVDTRKINKKVTESLVKCGAFDFTGTSRDKLFASVAPAMEAAAGVQRDREAGQGSIFDVLSEPGSSASSAGAATYREPTDYERWTDTETLAFEKETLGFYFSSHPLAGYKKEFDLYATCTIAELAEREDKDEVTVAGMAITSKEITTKKGGRMAFVRLEDLSGGVETIIFPDLYTTARELLASEKPLLVSARLDKAEDEVKLLASEIAPLEDPGEMKSRIKAKDVFITVPVNGAGSSEALKSILEVIQESPGDSRVFLRLHYPGDREVVIRAGDRFKVEAAAGMRARLKSAAPGVEVKVQ